MSDKVNILLVDDQPAKLLSYEVILRDLGENLIVATSASEALGHLLKSEIAVILVDVCMPELDGFQLAAMIREHPRFQRTAIIFISAIHLTDVDTLRGYEMGAVDYVPVPVIPEVLRAKVRVFAELYRKTRQLETLNRELEHRVAERTAELEQSTARLMQSERVRSLALAAGQMGSWDWDLIEGGCVWDEGQCRIFGVDAASFVVSTENVKALIHGDDLERLQQALQAVAKTGQAHQAEFRVRRPSGEIRWCTGTAAASKDAGGRIVRMSGVTVDITERRQAEERQALLAREVDHRARNALAVVQSIVRLSRAKTVRDYIGAVEGRIRALARAHNLLSQSRWQGADLRRLVEEELAPFRSAEAERVVTAGPEVLLHPATAQALAVVLHELSTNAAKYGALSALSGRVTLSWEVKHGGLLAEWIETGGPPIEAPASQGYGSKVISSVIERQLGGRASFEWRYEGLRCTFSIPANDNAMAVVKAGNDVVAEHNSAVKARPLPGPAVLLVEDEALVAMMMKDALIELGFSVLGPFGRVNEAVAVLEDSVIAAAVLDVNLGGELVYPLADILAQRKVPFIFVTGYGGESIESRFAQVPVLQKPIEPEALGRALGGCPSGLVLATGAGPLTHATAAPSAQLAGRRS